MKKIGLLGGTFDPVHAGHITIAHEAQLALELEQVAFIPCWIPPHRPPPIASAEHRLAMLSLATREYSRLAVNPIEIELHNVSYTVNTLSLLKKQHPEITYYYILGEDAFSQFDSWHEWQKILTLAHLVIVNRNHDDKTQPPSQTVQHFLKENNLGSHLYFLTIEPVLVSATHIRNAIQAGKKNIPGLDVAVQEYILKNNLYR